MHFAHTKDYRGGVSFTYAPVTRCGSVIPHVWGWLIPKRECVTTQFGVLTHEVALPENWVVLKVDAEVNGSHTNPFTLREFRTFSPVKLGGVITEPQGRMVEEEVGGCGCGDPSCAYCEWVPMWYDDPWGQVAMHRLHARLCIGFGKRPRGTGRADDVLLRPLMR